MAHIDALKEASHRLRSLLPHDPQIGLVMGSGLSDALRPLEDETVVSWDDVPYFPEPTVAGHAGRYVAGTLSNNPVLVQQGRVHYYEGKPMDEVVFPTRLMKMIGVETLVITNAAGAINENYRPGDFVLIKDHLNAIPANPLRGPNVDELGERFPNMNDAYSPELRRLAHEAADESGLSLHEGVYLAAPGPMYETPAEIQMYGSWGADLVGMSTVPEVIAARHCGLEVLGISLATNYAAGVNEEARPTHDEVIETSQRAEADLATLVRTLLAKF
ncbi:MAG: purine-nucleoside phosphorylase [Candidatus Bipolaricaulia bacterium]